MNKKMEMKKEKDVIFLIIVCICLGYLFLIGPKLTLTIHFEMDEYSEVGLAALYFDCGRGVNDTNAIRNVSQQDTIIFQIPFYKYFKVSDIRFDPINYVDNVTIKRMYFSLFGQEVYSISGKDFINNVIAYAGISGFAVNGNDGTVIVDDSCPNIYLDYEIVEEFNQFQLMSLILNILRIIFIIVFIGILLGIIRFRLRQEMKAVMSGLCNKVCTNHYKKQFIAVAFLVYVAVRIVIIINYQGFYFNDEFYFLAEGNSDYISDYNRAPYLVFLIKVFTSIAGNQYFAVKAVPLFCGIVSFACVMYLTYSLCQNSLSILLAGIMMTFHALFIFNDFYIRMYSFQEMELLILAVVLYRTKHSKKYICRIIWMLLGLIFAFAMYQLTEDMSGVIPFISYLCAVIYILIGEKIWHFLKRKGWLKFVFGCGGIAFIVVEILIVLVKNGSLSLASNNSDTSLISAIYQFMTEFRVEDSLVLVHYLLVDEILFTISFVLAGVWLFRQEKQEIVPIYLLTAIPMIVFCALLYNSRVMRTFIGYIAVMAVMVVMFWDYLIREKRYAFGVMLGCIITVLTSPVDLSWKQFTDQLYLYHEVYFCDYGQLMQDAYKYREEGKKIIALFGGEQVLAYFQFEPDVNMCVWDSNQNYNYTNEELCEKWEGIEETGNKYVLIMDKAGADKLHEAGMYYELLENNDYHLYNKNVEFNSLYLVKIE